MGDVVAPVARAVGPSRRLERVERVANGAVADGMDVDLEALRLEARGGLREQGRIQTGDAPVVRRAAIGIR